MGEQAGKIENLVMIFQGVSDLVKTVWSTLSLSLDVLGFRIAIIFSF